MAINRTARDFENALWDILDTRPFEDVTIESICAEALVHRSSFYRYFKDKRALLKSTLQTKLEKSWEHDDNPDLVDRIVTFIMDNRARFRNISIVGGENNISIDILTIIVKTFLEQPANAHSKITLALHRGDDPQMMAFILSGALTGVFVYCDQNDYDIPKKKVVKAFNNYFDYLLLAQNV